MGVTSGEQTRVNSRERRRHIRDVTDQPRRDDDALGSNYRRVAVVSRARP